jgi:hypothetical protein
LSNFGYFGDSRLPARMALLLTTLSIIGTYTLGCIWIPDALSQLLNFARVSCNLAFGLYVHLQSRISPSFSLW